MMDGFYPDGCFGMEVDFPSPDGAGIIVDGHGINYV